MAKPENTEYKKTTVVYVITKDFTCTNTVYGRPVRCDLPVGTELRKGISAWPTEGGLKWGEHTIPDGDFEIFHETETVKTTYTRRRGKG